MADYLFKQYNVKLNHPEQPLLYVNSKDLRVYLPTELCHDASLPENFTKDSRLVQQLD
jgi:hypothetical protein